MRLTEFISKNLIIDDLEATEKKAAIEEIDPDVVAFVPTDPDISAEPVFTPYTVAPRILNVGDIQTAMVRAYPVLLRDAGIGGTVSVWYFIDEEGIVQSYRINESSGFQALDDAALAVADLYRFSPATKDGEAVAVWVTFPITFAVR